ncbi:hypothetical protein JTB14_028536 [Gonioctena quinquepunctata]|nr:hypothetical protein JTB14_028536 [Gonioctena quinquepunctata]
MQLLLQLKNMGEVTDDGNIVQKGVEKSGERLTLNEVAAQCFVFFIAGFETSATTMTFALLELALNLNIQENLRREINTVLKKHEGEVTYDAVMEMSYLDKVIHETLRKHSPASFLMRACKKPYRVPGTNVILKAGTTVQIPVMAIHRDPEHYPDPEKFDPERFNEENKGKRHPMAFLPFGEGPRICIGARFGILQSKVGLISILKGFKVTLNEKTKLPIKYSIKSPISSVDGDVWINIAEIE